MLLGGINSRKWAAGDGENPFARLYRCLRQYLPLMWLVCG